MYSCTSTLVHEYTVQPWKGGGCMHARNRIVSAVLRVGLTGILRYNVRMVGAVLRPHE